MFTSEDLVFPLRLTTGFCIWRRKALGQEAKTQQAQTKYRMKKRRDELFRQRNSNKELDLLEPKIGSVVRRLKQFGAARHHHRGNIYYEIRHTENQDAID